MECELIHGQRPAQAIADFAASIDASLILAGTHCRTGSPASPTEASLRRWFGMLAARSP